MSSILASVDQRTRLAGHNRLELLLFRLHGRQRFGINVFKVREVITRPPLTRIPEAPPVMCGIAHLRGRTLPVLDLALAIGLPPLPAEAGYAIITEYNRSVQGFLVGQVDRIVNLDWQQIQPPPKGTGESSYLTAVTEYESELIEIIDVEKILKEIIGAKETVSAGVIQTELGRGHHILVVDDSAVARNQVKRVLDQLGVECTLARDGEEAFTILSHWLEEGKDLPKFLSLVLSDIEMPRMDGYALTTRIREHPNLQGLYVLLHSSLSGVFNEEMVKKVGADRFLAKFAPDELAKMVQEALRLHSAKPAA
jgi:two-component system chemotaxis response regulator CheV